MTVIKSFKFNDLKKNVKSDAKKAAMRIGFTEQEATNSLWYQTDVKGRVFGISENQIAVNWGKSNYHKVPIAGYINKLCS